MVSRIQTKLANVARFQSPYAPSIYFLATHLSKGAVAPAEPPIYAMGKGHSHKEAQIRMYGEAVERYSLRTAAAHQAWVVFDPNTGLQDADIKGADFGFADLVGSHGCAAHNHLNLAAQAAATELWERRIVDDWWRGLVAGADVPCQALKEFGLTPAIRRARAGAIETRLTRFLILDNPGPVHVAAAISTDITGGQIAIGFAGGPKLGATLQRSFLEVLSVELETADLYRAKLDGDAIVPGSNRALVQLRQDAVYAALNRGQAAGQHQLTGAKDSVRSGGLKQITDMSSDLGFPIKFADLTDKKLGVPVVRAFFERPMQNPFLAGKSGVLPI